MNKALTFILAFLICGCEKSNKSQLPQTQMTIVYQTHFGQWNKLSDKENIKIIKKINFSHGYESYSLVLTETRGVCVIEKAYDWSLIEEGNTYAVEVHQVQHSDSLDGVKFALFNFREPW